jgi:hypothetical protein
MKKVEFDIDNCKRLSNGYFLHNDGRLFNEFGREMENPNYSQDMVSIFETVKEIKEDEEDKEVQKKLEKIGTPGNRNIEDLLASFKVNKKEKGEIKDVDQLEDNSWDYDVAVGKGKSHSW